MIKSILVAADASAHAVAARDQAVELARLYGARILGVHVLDVRLLEMPPYLDYSYPFETIPISQFPLELLETFRRKAERVLDEFREAVEKAGVPVDVLLDEGIPPQVIAELGDGHDLIAIGKRGEHARWGKEFLGTTTEAVVRRATSPVLLAEQEARPLHNFLVLYDGSHSANQVLKLVADMASHGVLRLSVLTAAKTEADAVATQREARDYLGAFPLEVDYRTRTGDVVQAVFEELQQNSPDAVCMGLKGHSALRDLILGSTAEHLMREISVPVLLTP
jgi:nucleotide-binding universal stress UspA family protein